MPKQTTTLCVTLSLCFSMLVFPAHAAKLTKWVDANGRVHYGSSAPEGVSAQAVGASSQISSYESTGPEVVLYSTSWCGYCRKARAYMRRNDIDFEEYDIEKDSDAKQTYQDLGGRGVPFLVRGDEILRGYRESSYERFFDL